MPPRTILRCLHATWLTFSVLGGGVAAAAPVRHGDAAKAGEEPTPRLLSTAQGSSEPDVAACVDGFLAARQWVSTLAPPDSDDPKSQLTLPGVRGVSVILRHQGRTVGIGDDWPALAGDDRMLRRAVGRAIGRALGDRVIASLPMAERDLAGRQLAIEIEFAGRPEPLVGRTIADCVLRVDPGLDGLALRRASGGKPVWAVAYPSRLQATNTAGSPDRTLISLILDVGLPAKDLPDLVKAEPIGVFRFASLRLAQPSAEAQPTVRGRGTPRIGDDQVTPSGLIAHANGILERLRASMPPRDNESMRGVGLVGDYRPVADDYKPLIAPPGEQALAAWAAASLSRSPHAPEAIRVNAAALAKSILEDLAIQNPTEESPMATAPANCFALCAIATLADDASLSEAALDLGRIATEKLSLTIQSGSANDRALAALAAAYALGTEHRFFPASDLRKHLDLIWDGAPKDQLLGQFPWLILAESHYAKATGQAAARTTEARALAQLLFSVQAGFGELTAQQDIRGGFRLSAPNRAGVTAQSLRPGLGLAAMVAYPGFVADEAAGIYRERLHAFSRFVLELTADDELSRYFRNASRVTGGLRESLWDSTQPVAANAMAVLFDVVALDAGLGGAGGQ